MNRHFLASFIAFSLLSIPIYAAEGGTSNEIGANASSEEQSKLIQLIMLIETSKFDLAYSMGLEMNTEWEGDEKFDFNFALAAAQTGHFNQAVFPFERLLENTPNNLRFRLELARCYFFLNNLSAAEREFNLVANNNPPKEVQNNIKRFLDRIAEQKQQVNQTWVAGVGIAIGHDSNINAAADIDAINATFYEANIPVLTGSLNKNPKPAIIISCKVMDITSSLFQSALAWMQEYLRHKKTMPLIMTMTLPIFL